MMKAFDISRLSGKVVFDPSVIGYQDSIDIIIDELQNTRKSFVKIGWYLKHIDEGKMYEQDGYKDIFEFAHATFNMSKETANRFINICKEFSVGHDSPELDERYYDFTVSQLFEMLPMASSEREEVSPDMTVKQIREVKAEQKAKKEPTATAIKSFVERQLKSEQFASLPEFKEYMVRVFGKTHAGGGPNPNFICTPRGISLGNSDEMTWLSFAKKAWEFLDTKNAPVMNEKVSEESFPEDVYLDAESEESVNEKKVKYVADTTSEEIAPEEKESKKHERNPEELFCEALFSEAGRLIKLLYNAFFEQDFSELSSAELRQYKEWTFRINSLVYELYNKHCI